MASVAALVLPSAWASPSIASVKPPALVLSGEVVVHAQAGAACAATPLPERVALHLVLQQAENGAWSGLAWGAQVVPTKVQGQRLEALSLSWLAPGLPAAARVGHRAELQATAAGVSGRWREAPPPTEPAAAACFWTDAEVLLHRADSTQLTRLRAQADALAAYMAQAQALWRPATGSADDAPVSRGFVRPAPPTPPAEAELPPSAAALQALHDGLRTLAGTEALDSGIAATHLDLVEQQLASRHAERRQRAALLLQPLPELLQRALQQSGGDWPAIAERTARLLRASGQPGPALAVLGDTLRALASQGQGDSQEAAVIMSGYGSLLLRERRVTEAVAVFERALALELKHGAADGQGAVVASVNLARALQRQDQTVRAIQILAERLRAVEGGPDTPARTRWRELLGSTLESLNADRGLRPSALPRATQS